LGRGKKSDEGRLTPPQPGGNGGMRPHEKNGAAERDGSRLFPFPEWGRIPPVGPVGRREGRVPAAALWGIER